MKTICKFGKSGKTDIVKRFSSSSYDVTILFSWWLPKYVVDLAEQLILAVTKKDFYTSVQYDGITEMRELSTVERKHITRELYKVRDSFLAKYPEFKVDKPWEQGWQKLYLVETSIKADSPARNETTKKPELSSPELDPLTLAIQETQIKQVDSIKLNPSYEIKDASFPNKTVKNVFNALAKAGDSFVDQFSIGSNYNYNPHGVRCCISRLRKEVGIPVINKRGKGWKIAHSKEDWLQYLNSNTGKISDINFIHTGINKLWERSSA